MGSSSDAILAALIGAGGAVVGAVIAWIGVWLQLRHATCERDKERQMALRRDVYLLAMRQIGDMMDYILNLCGATRPAPGEYTSAITQVHMVGTDETVHAAIKLNSRVAQALFRLLPKKQELDLLVGMEGVLQQRQKESLQQIGKWVEEMKQYNLQGRVDPQKWSVIEGNYNLVSDQFGEAYSEYRRNLKMRITRTSQVAQECFEQIQEVEQSVAPFIMAVRKEIGTPVDEEAYHRIMTATGAEWKSRAEAFISTMKDSLEKAMEVALPEDPSE